MQVTLFRTHPQENWFSMNRYADNLQAALLQTMPPGWKINVPLPHAFSQTYLQLVIRNSYYPLWAYKHQGSVNHILDHSYGNIARFLNTEQTVITVHDIAPLHFSGRKWGISQSSWMYAWRTVQKARHIITDSQFIAEELKKSFRFSPKTTFYVVPLAVAPIFRPLSKKEIKPNQFLKFDTDGQFLLLHVGHTQPRKNFPTIIKALAQLQRRGISFSFIQVGSSIDKWDAQITQAGLSHKIHFTGRVSDQQLVQLYNLADLFVFPSLYEGFGLPVLEAMACGTPVVTSNQSSLPEVSGNAALLCDPTSYESLAEAIERVLMDESLASGMRHKGVKWAANFTWHNTAQKTWQVYTKLAKKL